MYKFHSVLSFDDLDPFEPYQFELKLKNNLSFKFLDIYYIYKVYRYNNGDIDFYLSADYYSTDDDITKSNDVLKFSTRVLSYIFRVPLGEIEEFTGCEEVVGESIPLISCFTEKTKHLQNVEQKIVRFSKQSELFQASINHYYNGFKFTILDGFDEDAFIYYFKCVEIIVKEYYRLNQSNKINFDKADATSFLIKYYKKSAMITFSENKLNQIRGELMKFLYGQINNDIFTKISFFSNNNKLIIDENKLSTIVRIRNKIAHGDKIEDAILQSSLTRLIHLCRDVISANFFGVTYSKLSLESRFM